MKRTILYLILSAVMPFSFTCAWSQDIYGNGTLTIPQSPATSYEVTSGQTVHIYGGSQVVLGPGTSFDGGSNVTVTVSPGGVVPLAPNNPSSDGGMNWKISTIYDGSGNQLSSEKQFYGILGNLLQTQDMVQYRYPDGTYATHVLANQPILDALGRPVLNTLSAPINNSGFAYSPSFVQNASGAAYSHEDFDLYTPVGSGTQTDNTNTPGAVGSSQIGTLGWYYSANNNWENYTPTTQYPYSRDTYYSDGTGRIDRSAGTGESFKMGSGHEVSVFESPVVSELVNYLQIRNAFFGANVGSAPTNISQGAFQRTALDANGNVVDYIQSSDGRVLMVARPGTDLQVADTLTMAAATGTTGTNFYFALLSTQNVVVTGSTSYTLFDMRMGSQVSFSGSASLPAGFYKIVNNSTSPLHLQYANGFTQVTYYFYNQLGEPLATISPNGVKLLETPTQISNYSSASSLPFTALNTFDLKGRLLSTSSPDGGLTQYVFRKSGQLRFSQNAKQRVNGQFTYINYDAAGRIVESGQSTPGSGGVTFTNDMTVASNMQSILEVTTSGGGLNSNTNTDVTRIHYDEPDASYGLSNYQQDEYNLRGHISFTERYSQLVNETPVSSNLVSSTWYNYDEQGKVVWCIKYINGLGYKTSDYTYDNSGRLIKKIFQAGTSSETFVHYFTYDSKNGKILQVSTNTVDNIATAQLQGNYIYSLQGGLKRLELGKNIQGLDYTYTLQGQLKAINNSNAAGDPGLDGSNGFVPDAFGMVLDYYTNDYQNSRTGIPAINGVNASSIVPTDIYGGPVKAISWFSDKPASTGASSNPNVYVYKYDNNYFLNSATFGTGLNFSNTPATFNATATNQENILNPSTGASGYDQNGNILYLQRTDVNGNSKDKFAYSYSAVNNQLQSVTTTSSGSSQTFASYGYDQAGETISETSIDPTQTKYIQYDSRGMVTGIYRDAAFSQPVVQLVYDENGYRIIKKSYNSTYQLATVTYYVGRNVVYSQNVLASGGILPQEYVVSDGAGDRLATYYSQSQTYAYELRDQNGSVRAIVASSSGGQNVTVYNDYYPFGLVLQTGGSTYRYGYQGVNAELDGESGLNAFKKRMYDSRVGRWLSVDRDEQTASGYSGMGNNPVTNVDLNGNDFYYDPVSHSIQWMDSEDPWVQDDQGVYWIDYYGESGYRDAKTGEFFWHDENGVHADYDGPDWMEQIYFAEQGDFGAIKRFWSADKKFDGDVDVKVTFGTQFGASVETPYGEVTAGAGVYVFDAVRFHHGFSHPDKDNGMHYGWDDDARVHFFASACIAPANLPVNVGGSIDAGYRYGQGSEGLDLFDGETEKEFGVGVNTPEWASGHEILGGAAKVGGVEDMIKTDQSDAEEGPHRIFYGVNIGAAAKVFLGIDVHFNLGFDY